MLKLGFLPRIILWAVVILYGPQETIARVTVEVGHWMQPLLNNTDDIIILENKDIVIQLKCMASYPTEWIFNDDNLSTNSKRRLRIEWTDRKFHKSIDESIYDYIAWIQLQYTRLIENEILICAAVSNHNDRIVVKFQPNNNDEVQITNFQTGNVKDYDFAVPALKTAYGSDSDSDFAGVAQLSFVSLESGYYWHCQLQDGSLGRITFHDCRYSAAYCANSFLAVKQLGKRVTVMNSSEANTYGDDWTRMSKDKVQIPGVAVCSGKDKGGQLERIAVEYFFSSGVEDNALEKSRPQLHFSWKEIQPQDLIWMDPIVKDTFSTRETLKTGCHVPKYGFSFDPVFVLTLNGTRLLMERDYLQDHKSESWIKKVEIEFANYGPGEYTIQCIAPVWNTTQWIYKTKTISVIDTQQIISPTPKVYEDMGMGETLDKININILQLATVNTDHFLEIESSLDKLVRIQERRLEIAEELLQLRKQPKPNGTPNSINKLQMNSI